MHERITPANKNKVVAFERARGPGHKRPNNRAIARLHILGPMRATSFLGADILPRGRKARAILGCLCLARGARVPRSRLAAMLWDRVPDVQARASFRQALREMIQAFGDLAGELISTDRETVALNTAACWIDALAITAPGVSPDSRRGELAAHCTGELLEELDGLTTSFDHWLLGERTLFVERRRALLEAELDEAHGEHADAHERAEIARRLILFDPTHEGASRILMRALADMGERPQALREYERCREALRLRLDVEPSPETVALYEAIRMFSGREEREAEPPPSVARPKKQKAPQQAAARNRLRVGVLPFFNSTPSEENLALSLSQEIAAALARFRWFDVIPPVALKRRDAAGQIGDDLLRPNEIDFVLDGSLSSYGGLYQISVRLLDLTRYASPVWSEKFELRDNELHLLNERVTARVVGRIDPVILFIEGQPKRREKFGATGLLLQAIPLIYSMEPAKFEEAGELISRALDIDPDDSMVVTWAAYWHLWHVGQGLTADPMGTLTISQDLCLRALRLDPENAEAAGFYAHCCAWKKDFDTALEFFDRALKLNPNLAYIWALSAATFSYMGEAKEALRRLERYRELAPFDPYSQFFDTIFVIAHLFDRDYQRAATVGRRVVTANPDFINGYKPLIAALGHLGKADEAKQYIKKLRDHEPTFSVRSHAEIYPFRREIDRDDYLDGLRKAGVPET